MDAGNLSGGRGEVREDREPLTSSSSDDELPRNPVVQQGVVRTESVGEEAASNIVGGGRGTGPLGSSATPTDLTHAAATSSLTGSKRSRRHSWVWNHFSINENFINESGIDIGARGVCHYCDKHYKCISNNGGVAIAVLCVQVQVSECVS
jgi:hypothetical protein